MSVNDRIATQVKRYAKITPSNASSTGVFSYSQGNPIIRLTIAEADAMLMAPECRLQFRLKGFSDFATPKTPLRAAGTTNLDSKIGAQSVIQTLTISSRRYATSITEQILNYNQLVSVAHPALESARDTFVQRSHEEMCIGKGIQDRDELNQTQENSAANNTNVIDLQRRLISTAGTQAQDIGWDCSIQLYSGMFMSDQGLDLRLLGGLEIEITLASDVNVFDNATSTTNYEMSDVVLNCPLLYKSAGQMAQGVSPSSFSFLSYTSLYNVVQSTNATITNKVGLRGALAMIQKFVPTKYINNFAVNAKAFAGWNPGIKRLVFHRNGQRFPLEYGIKTDRGDGNPAAEVHGEKTPQILLNSLSAFENYKDVKHSHFTNQNLHDQSDGVYYLGISFDQVSGQGIDLSGGTVSTELESTLQDPVDNTAITFGVYTFFLNKTTLVISPNNRIQSIE